MYRICYSYFVNNFFSKYLRLIPILWKWNTALEDEKNICLNRNNDIGINFLVSLEKNNVFSSPESFICRIKR